MTFQIPTLFKEFKDLHEPCIFTQKTYLASHLFNRKYFTQFSEAKCFSDVKLKTISCLKIILPLF